MLRRCAAAIFFSLLPACDGCEDKRPSAPSDASQEATTVVTPERDGAVVNQTTIPTASVLAVVNPFDAAPYDGPSGSIEGTVTVSGDPPPSSNLDFSKCPSAEPIDGKLFRVGPNDALADAVVAVQAFPTQFIPEKNEAKTVHIEGCTYAERTITLTFGQRLDVKNDGDLIIFPGLEPLTTPAMMAAPPHGDPVRFYPPKPGRYRLVDLGGRKYMTVDVFVSPHPMHATTDVKGHYRIDGIPVGKRQVQAHHPAIGDGPKATVRDIDIVAGVVQKLDFVVKYSNAPSDAGAAATASQDAGAATVTRQDGGTPAARDGGNRTWLR